MSYFNTHVKRTVLWFIFASAKLLLNLCPQGLSLTFCHFCLTSEFLRDFVPEAGDQKKLVTYNYNQEFSRKLRSFGRFIKDLIMSGACLSNSFFPIVIVCAKKRGYIWWFWISPYICYIRWERFHDRFPHISETFSLKVDVIVLFSVCNAQHGDPTVGNLFHIPSPPKSSCTLEMTRSRMCPTKYVALWTCCFKF